MNWNILTTILLFASSYAIVPILPILGGASIIIGLLPEGEKCAEGATQCSDGKVIVTCQKEKRFGFFNRYEWEEVDRCGSFQKCKQNSDYQSECVWSFFN
jgi:hypothetical protein